MYNIYLWLGSWICQEKSDNMNACRHNHRFNNRLHRQKWYGVMVGVSVKRQYSASRHKERYRVTKYLLYSTDRITVV